jgi:hypothetical protein
MTSLRHVLAFIAALAAALIGGCASTPEASPDRDAAAKEFLTQPSAGTIYVYRSQFDDYDMDSVLYMDGRLIGATRPGAYFRIQATPGHHVLHGNGIDIGEFRIDTRPGQLYFVSLDVIGGQSNYRLVPQQLAERQVRECCVLFETWAPGQRPFLR